MFGATETEENNLEQEESFETQHNTFENILCNYDVCVCVCVHIKFKIIIVVMHIVLILVNGKRHGIVIIVKIQFKLLECAIIPLSHTRRRERSQHFICAQDLRNILDAGTYYCERCIIKLVKLGIWGKKPEEEAGKNSQRNFKKTER